MSKGVIIADFHSWLLYKEESHKPLNDYEKQLLIDECWVFRDIDFIEIEGDYDGSFAEGIPAIRKILKRIKEKYYGKFSFGNGTNRPFRNADTP